MEKLLPELLDLILATCADYALALRAVCRRWRTVAEQLPAKRPTAEKGLSFLARNGHARLLEWVLECRSRRWAPPQADGMLCWAALGGHERLCEQAKAWGATAWNGMLENAARGGHAHLCEQAKAWGATDWDGMLIWAAAIGGHERLCEQAKAWGATDWDGMLIWAARGGHERLCELAQGWAAEAGKPLSAGALADAAKAAQEQGHADLATRLEPR